MTAVRRSKSRPSRSGRKCLRPGPIGRNPYLNFLREFRKRCCGMSAIKTVQQGAKAWNQLGEEEKRRYIEEAFYAPKLRRKSMRGRRSIKRSARRGGRRMSRSRRSRKAHSSKSRSNRRKRSAKQGHTIMCNL